MDYAKQDEADLRKLIELYRNGYVTSDWVEKISERWEKQSRMCNGLHVASKDVPIPKEARECLERFLSGLGN